MKEKIHKEYYRRIKLVLGSELNAVNRTNAINTLAVPVVTYSFNIIEDLKNCRRSEEIGPPNKEATNNGENAPPQGRQR